MLPTSFRDSGFSRRPPPTHFDALFLYRGSLLLRGLTAAFLVWIAWQFPDMVWPSAWTIGIALFLADILAVLAHRMRPTALKQWVRATVLVDGLFGWAVAWSYSQSPETIAPVLLSLFTIELLAYFRRRWGALLAGGYILVTNGLLGIVPGIHGHALWPWSRVLFWIIADALVWGALIIFAQLSLWNDPTASLTPREREVYQLAQAGRSVPQIAERLHIEASTVKTHLSHIHHKLDLSQRDDT